MRCNPVRKNRRGMPTWFWLFIASVVVGQGILIYNLIEEKDSAISAIGWLTGAFIPAVAFIFGFWQKHSLWFFLRVQYIRSFFSSQTPAWSLSAHFSGENITEETLDQITKKVVSRLGSDRVRVRIIKADTRHILVTPGPTLEVVFNQSEPSAVSEFEADKSAYIQAYIRNYQVGYRQAVHAIRYDLLPLLEDISNVIKSVDTRYTMTIEFDKNNNPFFGLYVSQFNPDLVASFSVRLMINGDPHTTIQVSETRITINAPTQSALQNLAIEFLTFNSKLQERCDGRLFSV
jgi:hypothetical protein